LKRAVPLARRSALAHGAARLKSRRRQASGTVAQRAAFRLAVCHEHARCAVTDDGWCDGGLEAHHVVSQQAIRALATERGYGPEHLARLLWDTRNGLAVCGRHHARHTLARRRIPLAVLGPGHAEFACQLGLDYLIDRTYRRREETAA
jgi:hypothetical protein